MIDLHSHIIWDIDDGSRSEEMTINMLREAADSGTEKIVATPHYVKGEYVYTYKEAKEKLEEVKALAKRHGIDIDIYSGQEVYYKENLIELFENKEIGTLNESKYMLIELPMNSFSIDEVMDSIHELTIRGIVPILAHPERYRPFIKEPELINQFISEGYLFQLNTGSIAGYFGKDVKKTAEIFVENKVYNFIGSDAHRDSGRSTDMREGIEKIDNNYLKEIKISSESLLNNSEVVFLGNKVQKKKKGFFSFFKI